MYYRKIVQFVCGGRKKARSLRTYSLMLLVACMITVLVYFESRYTVYEHTEKPARASDFVWTNIRDQNWKLFSAYIDNRSVEDSFRMYKRSLVTMGYEKGPADYDLHCVIIWSDGSRIILQHDAQRIPISEMWKKRFGDFRAYFYRCNLTGITATPRYVTLIEKNSTDFAWSISSSIFIPVVDPYSELLHEFGVCFETPLFGDRYKQIVVDSIEMNRLLGATWFTLYIHNGSRWTMDVLKSYTEQGILDGVYNFGENSPSPTYMRGVIVGIQDCLYRNMYKVKYLAFCDFDEVLTPLKHLNWHDLITEIDREKIVYFSFHHVAFHANRSSKTIYFNCPGSDNKVYQIPHYFATSNRSVNVFPKWLQAKSILKPSYHAVIHVHNYGLMTRRSGYRSFVVPQDMGLLQHFRDKDDPRHRKYNSTIDHSMEKFKPPLLREVEKKICG